VAALAALVLAFQVWDAFGWTGQALFTWRVVDQWVHSERAKRSVVPPTFWGTSFLGSLCRIVYDGHRADPVYLSSDLASGCIYARNWWMSRRPSSPRAGHAALWPLFVGLALFSVTAVQAAVSEKDLFVFDRRMPWPLIGFVGSALWSGRFVVQWWESERKGHSHLPASFFWMSLVGSVCLFSYAVWRVDWVNMASYALNPIPYARNLVLLRRHARAGTPPAADSGGGSA
jgi:lipid-A-disaccharide synthase-like uncharacterized protein